MSKVKRDVLTLSEEFEERLKELFADKYITVQEKQILENVLNLHKEIFNPEVEE